MFRFLHLADLHLETHFGGRPETKRRLRAATHEAFERAIDFAIDEGLHAVLAAGDLYDDHLLSLRTEARIARAVQRLDDAGIAFLWTCGNHDPGGAQKRAARMQLDGGPDSLVHVFRKAKPETVIVADRDGRQVGVVVGSGHVMDREDRNLAASFTKLETDLPVVGLLHTQVESAKSADNHDRYAPSRPLDYERLDYAYFALGHVHLRQQAVEGLPVWYPGNLQGRNARETGQKGGLLVEARSGVFAEPRFVPFAPVRWERVACAGLEDVTTVTGLVDRLEERVADTRAGMEEELAIRLVLTGPCPLARVLRDREERASLEEELIERTDTVDVQLRTSGLRTLRDLEALRRVPSVLQKSLDLIEEARSNPELRARLAPEPLAGHSGEDGLDEYLSTLLEGLEDELIEHCLEEEAG